MRALGKWLWLVALLVSCAHPPKTARPVGNESPAGCNSPLGFIPEGESLTGYRDITVPAGKTCRSGQLQCIDGVWTGIYIHRACTVLPE